MTRPARSDDADGKIRPSIALVLILELGGLTFLAAGLVLAVALLAGGRNTVELLRDKTRYFSENLALRTGAFLDPARDQAEQLAQRIETGAWFPADDARSADILTSSLAPLRQVRALVFVSVDGWTAGAARDGAGEERPEFFFGPSSNLDQVRIRLDQAERRPTTAPYWDEPLFIDDAGATLLNLQRPVRRNGRFLGLVVSTITVQALSTFVAGLATEPGQKTFILYDRDRVLAHPALLRPGLTFSSERPLPRVTEVGDPVLGSIWREGFEDRTFDLIEGGHADEVGGVDYVYIYRTLDAYADAPWTVGGYMVEDAADAVLDRLALAAWTGLAVILLALATALWLGNALGRPMRRLAAAAAAVRDLDLDDVPRLPRSRFRELDVAARAFNDMTGALRAFGLYVPRTLVRRLLREGDVAALPSEEREVTVMFTDIAGFTRLAETMEPGAVAALLNRHFDRLTTLIEAEGGTVDKFIGDGLMAFWGAPEARADHAERAVRAAAAIAAAVARDNRGPGPRLRLRVGLCGGPAVVGNIGSATRKNYTLIGDTVNAAQRLEQLGRGLHGAEDVVVLLGAETAEAARGFACDGLGAHVIRGRTGPLEVFRLVTPPWPETAEAPTAPGARDLPRPPVAARRASRP